MSHDRTLTRPEAAPAQDGDPRAGVRALDDASSGPRAAAPSPGGDAVTWAWATEHSPPERASAQQLVSWLARGELAAHTLVWRPGWGEWLPAVQVAELAAAFPYVTPGNRRVAQAAPPGSSTPPPVPVGHCPRIRLLAKDVVGSAPLTAVSQGLAPAPAARRTLRDLDDLQQDVVTSQVPAAAMLEAARAMKGLGPTVAPSGVERWSRLDLGTFGEAPPRSDAGERRLRPIPEGPRSPSSSTTIGRTLSPQALELDFSALAEPELERAWGRPRRYGLWLALGLTIGSVLGLLALRERSPRAAAQRTSAHRAAEAPPLPAFRTREGGDIDGPKPSGEPALLRGLSVTPQGGFDRVVFEFRERVPSFHVASVDGPVHHCKSGEPASIASEGRLEVRFHPASASTASGGRSIALNPLDPALVSIREIGQTCDMEGVAAWVIGVASRPRYRAFELAEPPRLVVDIAR